MVIEKWSKDVFCFLICVGIGHDSAEFNLAAFQVKYSSCLSYIKKIDHGFPMKYVLTRNIHMFS